jgi:hypothetical protein
MISHYVLLVITPVLYSGGPGFDIQIMEYQYILPFGFSKWYAWFILQGEQIEMMLGSVMVLSTMAAAALGNTISDVMGIGSAWYVERLAARIGMRPPKLSPIQLDMPSSRRAANMVWQWTVCTECINWMHTTHAVSFSSAIYCFSFETTR